MPDQYLCWVCQVWQKLIELLLFHPKFAPETISGLFSFRGGGHTPRLPSQCALCACILQHLNCFPLACGQKIIFFGRLSGSYTTTWLHIQLLQTRILLPLIANLVRTPHQLHPPGMCTKLLKDMVQPIFVPIQYCQLRHIKGATLPFDNDQKLILAVKDELTGYSALHFEDVLVTTSKQWRSSVTD